MATASGQPHTQGMPARRTLETDSAPQTINVIVDRSDKRRSFPAIAPGAIPGTLLDSRTRLRFLERGRDDIKPPMDEMCFDHVIGWGSEKLSQLL